MSKSTHQRKSRIESARPNRAADKALPLRRTWPVSLCVGLALGSIVFSGEALAGGPTGGVVVGGSGSITQSGNSTVINQASQKLALNWQTFNVGANESVLFNQPSRSAVALNRILDQNPSQIFGRINSNGQIFLINTHGIIFGATAQMNVGGLLASTLDLTPNDFLAGHYNLNASGAGAGIVNHGLIQAASGGSVALVGGSVLNDGLIFANYGKINLDGADHAVLDFDGNGLINIQITGELKQRLDQREAAVTNKGTLRAEDGTVVLQASATKDLFTNLVNNTGIVDASGISTDGGVVRLVANGGNIESSGSINVSGVHGGSAQLLSDKNVGVTGGSIDASGALGGGSIRVGGGWQGGEGLQTAAAAYVAPDAVLRADATQRGDGGSVVVWGNDANNFYGSISARGGALGGSGGRVETSSHYGLNVHGGVDAAAPQGNAGTWLLDPYDVTISGGADANTGTAPNYTASGTGSVVNAGGIGTALTGGTNVFVFTNTASNGAETGNITLSAPIAAAGAGSLYLEAVGSILLDSTITGKNAGSPLNVFLWANYGGAAAGTSYSSNAACATCQVVIGNSASAGITTYGGNVDIRTGDGTYAGGGLQLGTSGTITGSINAGSGSLGAITTGISQQATGASTILTGAANLDGGAGAISLTNTGNNFSGAVSLRNSGNNAVTLNNGSNALQLGTSSLGSGTLTVNAGSITQNGAITQASAAGAASFNASNAITLNNAGNSFTGAVGLTGSNLSLVNNTATVLGTTTATGTLSVASNGVLSQTGVLSATGNATFTQNSTSAAATQDIDLGSQNNNFQNGVTFAAGAGAGINNLSLKNTYASPGTLTLPASIAGNLTLNYTTASLTAPAASVGGALDLTAAGGIRISGNVTSTGAQAYHSAVTLGANATLATTNGNVSFDSTVDNATTTARNLTVNAGSGAVTFGGAVGGNATNGALGALTINSTGVTGFSAAVKAASLTTNAGGSTVLGSDVTTSGTQTYNDAVTLGSDLMLSTTNNSVSFGGTVDNASTTARNLTVNAGSGAVTFGGAVGGNATNGALGALAVNSTGVTSFNAAVKAASLITNAGGSTVLGGDVTTSGTQTYNDAVTLGSNLTLSTTNSNVSFGGTVDNASTTARNLTVNAGSGAVTFGGAVGGNATNGPLGALAVNSTGVTSFNAAVKAASLITNGGGSTVLGGNVTTSGTQTYGDTVTLSGNATLTGTTVSLVGVTGAGNNLTVAGNAVLGGAVSGLNTLQVDGTTALNIASVNTTGSQTYTGAVTLGVDTTLASSGNGAIGFGSTVDGAYALTVNTGGITSFGGAVGGTTMLTSLTTDAGGSTMLGGNVTTSGAQTYNDAVTLGSDATLTTTNNNIGFAGTVDNVSATARNLTVNAGSGAVTFGGTVGGGANGALSGLTASGGTLTAGTLNIGSAGLSVTTTAGGLTQGGAFTVAGASSFTAVGNAITLTNAANAFTGAVSLAGSNVSLANNTATVLGTTTATGTLDVSSNGALSQTGAVSATGLATFTQNSVTAGATQDINLGSQNNSFQSGVTLAAGLGAGINNLSLKNTFAAPGTLTLPASVAGNLTLNYTTAALTVPMVGVGSALDVTAGGGITINGNVTTGGAQTYHSAVALGADTTLASSGNGNIGFGSTVDGAYALTVNTGGVSSFGGALGGTTALTSLTTDAGGSTTLGGNVATSGAQTYGDAVTLGGNATLTSSGSGAIGFGSTVNGAYALVMNTGGAVSFGGAAALTGLSVSSGTFGANALNIGNGGLSVATSAGNIVQGGAFTVAGAANFNAGSNAITLTNAGNAFTGALGLTGGNVSLVNGTATVLGTTTAGTLNVSSSGALNQIGILTVTGSATFTQNSTTPGATQDIDLGTQNNSLQGGVTFAAGLGAGINNLSLKNTFATPGTLTLPASVAGNLTLNYTNAALTLPAVGVGGALDATAGGGITINGSVSTSGAQAYHSAVTLGADATLASTGNGAIGFDSTVNGAYALTVNTGGATSFGGAVGATSALTSLTTDAGGSTTLGGNVTTSGAQTYGDVVALSADTTLASTSGGAIGFGAAVNGAHALTVNTGGAASFGGVTALTGLTANSGTFIANGLDIGSGGLSVTTSTGGIGQGGAFTVAGTSSFNAGGSAITLTNANNDFVGALNLSGGTTQITDKNALTLGTLGTGALTVVSSGALNLGAGSVGGNLAATSNNGAISQAGALTVTGSSTLNAGSGAITLISANNDFVGALSLSGGTTQVTDRNALTLGTLGTGALTAKSTGALNLGAGSIGGALSATSNNGAISQTGALLVSGTSTINAGSGAITLTNAGNDFAGAVNLTGGTTQVTDANALTLGTLATGALTAVSHGALTLGAGSIGGALSATSNNGAISQAGALLVSGTSAINAGSGAITLTNAGNDFAGAVTAAGTGVQISDANDLAIAGLTNGANGAVSLVAGGALTLPAGAINTGTSDLVLVSNGGALGTPGSLSGQNVSLTGQGGLVLNGNVSAPGTLSLTSGADIQQSAGIITAGTLTGSSVGNTALGRANLIGTLGSFSAANFSLTNAQALTVTGPLTTTGDNGDIALSTTSGALTVNTGLVGHAIALTSVDNLSLSNNVSGNTVTLTSGGNISQGGGVITAGTLSGSAAGSATLGQANKVAALGAFSANGFSLVNGQALAVTGPLNGGVSTSLTTTTGNLAINGAVSGTATTLKSAGTINEGAGGGITAGTLSGQSAGATTLNGANHIGTLGSFTAAGFALTNAQALAVAGPVNGGASTSLTTTAGDLSINGAVSGTVTALKSAGAISQGAGGSLTAATLSGQSAGAAVLNGVNRVGTLGSFTAAGFALSNAQALTVSGPVDGGASTTLTTTAGDLAINGAVSGTTTTLHSAAAITEGAGGSITADLLTGSSVGNATMDGSNHINKLGAFSSDFSLTNAQTLTVVGPLDGGPSVSLTTTAGDLVINGSITATTTTLKSAGAISQGAAGSIVAGTLSGQSAGATALNGANRIGTLGSFTAAGFALTNAQTLTVSGPVSGGASTTLKTTAGDLAINGALSGTQTTLTSAGAIREGSGGVITASTLSGSAAGPTMLGGPSQRNNNMVSTLGNFSSPAGFSMTNNQTLTLASVAGSTFTVNAGTSASYLSVTNGDLFQQGTTPLYNGTGIWGSTGRMGTAPAPIYVVGTGVQMIANIGLPPAYFYAVDSAGNLLPLGGGLAVNVPTASGAGSAQNGNHGDSYIDPGVITANYRSYGIVPSGVRLPADQQGSCDPDQPDQPGCDEGNTVGMVGVLLNVRR